MAARDAEAYWVYAIEIDPRWMHAATAGSKTPIERFVYVGSTKKANVRARLEEHLRGERGFGSGAGCPFKRVRAPRLATGLPGSLVEGQDAWLEEKVTERCTWKAAARGRGRPQAGAHARDPGPLRAQALARPEPA
jgi:hypothetical protein